MIFVQIGKFHFDIQKRNLEPIFAKPQTLQNRQQKKSRNPHIHTTTKSVLALFSFQLTSKWMKKINGTHYIPDVSQMSILIQSCRKERYTWTTEKKISYYLLWVHTFRRREEFFSFFFFYFKPNDIVYAHIYHTHTIRHDWIAKLKIQNANIKEWKGGREYRTISK